MMNNKNIVAMPRKERNLKEPTRPPALDINDVNADEIVSAEIKRVLNELNLPYNKKTKAFVKGFINENGGYEKFRKEITKLKKLQESLISSGLTTMQYSHKLEPPSYPVPPAPPITTTPTKIKSNRIDANIQLPPPPAPPLPLSTPPLAPPPPPISPPPVPFNRFRKNNEATSPMIDTTIPISSKAKQAPTPPLSSPVQENLVTANVEIKHRQNVKRPPAVVPRTKQPILKSTGQLTLQNLKQLTANDENEKEFEKTKLAEIFSKLSPLEYKHENSLIDSYSIKELLSNFNFYDLYEMKIDDIKSRIEEEMKSAATNTTVLRTDSNSEEFQNILENLKYRLSVRFQDTNDEDINDDENEKSDSFSNSIGNVDSINFSYDNTNTSRNSDKDSFDLAKEPQEEYEKLVNFFEPTVQLVNTTTVVRDENSCKLCDNGKIECVFVDCGHMISCLNCGSNLKTCPICKEPIIKALKFHK